ncbi:MAG: adenosylcobinamide-GDP ribazoletransferase [Proteobacteria bacterium]|nr:adenosylcobinamide-GDP ribazoletransferase [Pseudomonadota bacterium]
MHWLKACWIAFQFLTRIPVPAPETATDEDYSKSLIFYPLVGLVIGLILVLLQLPFFSAAAGMQAAILLTVWVLITGALHLDGLGDSADGWLGGQGDRARTLEIMKDTHNGVAAVVLIILVLLLKFAALSQLLASTPGWTALIAAPVLARAAVVALMLTTEYVREAGIGTALVSQIPSKAAWLSIAISVALSALFLGLWAPLVLVLTAVIAVAIRMLMVKRIGGTTGDTAGAMIEIIEATVLVGAALAVS